TPARRRRMAGHCVEGDGERVGEHRLFVAQPLRYGEEHGRMSRHELRIPARGVARHPGVDTRADGSGREAVAEAVVAGDARWAYRRDPAGYAGQPGVEHNTLAHLNALGLGSELAHLGHDLVAHDLRERAYP